MGKIALGIQKCDFSYVLNVCYRKVLRPMTRRCQPLGFILAAFLMIGASERDARGQVKQLQQTWNFWLLDEEPVRRELGISAEQKQKIDTRLSEMRKRAGEQRLLLQKREQEALLEVKREFGIGDGEATDPTAYPPGLMAQVMERQRAIRQLGTEQIKSSARNATSEALKEMTPDGLRRFYQLDLRSKGPSAFADPTLARILNLDDAKFEEIQGVLQGQTLQSQKLLMEERNSVKNSRDPRYPRNTDGSIDAKKYSELLKTSPEFRKLVENRRADFDARSRRNEDQSLDAILKLLTRKQRESYVKLLGEPFDRDKFTAKGTNTSSGPLTPAPEKPSLAPKPVAAPPSLRERRGLPK